MPVAEISAGEVKEAAARSKGKEAQLARQPVKNDFVKQRWGITQDGPAITQLRLMEWEIHILNISHIHRVNIAVIQIMNF